MFTALVCLSLIAQFAQDLDPREYTSPSGEYVLRVDPSARDGSGPGTYSLQRGGTQAWQRELPFTLRAAVVADDGTSAGFGHAESSYRAEGDFVVALLSPRGQLLLEDRTERTPGLAMHSSPLPAPLGLFLQHDLRRAVIRIDDPDIVLGSDSWWTFELDPARLHSKLEPRSLLGDAETMRRSFDARGVPGTPLTLAHWYLWDWPEIGGRFVLHDEDYREVWRLDLPTDYQAKRREGELLDQVREHGAILATDARRFELRFFRDAQRVTFEVRPDPEAATGWTVVESARAEFFAPELPAAVEIATLELPLIERVALGDSGSKGEPTVRDVVSFDVDAEGAVRFIRRKKGAPAYTAVTLAPDGTPTSETTLEPLPADVDDNVLFEPLAGEDWLVVASSWGFQEAGRSLAWRLNGSTGEFVELTAFAADTVEAVAPLADGGFAALAQSRGSWAYRTLSVHGPDGGARWSLAGHDVENQVLLSPADLALAGDGLLALVDNIRDTVEVFDLAGGHVCTLQLAELWSREPNYPVGITPDVDAGVIVFDFNGDPPIWRMSLLGEVRASFRPRFPDGNAPSVLARNLRLGGDARLWTTDGSAFLRLDEEGVVEHHLGAPPGVQLEQPAAMEIDHLGRVLVQDARTGTVHVFDRRGAQRFVCVPDPTDYEHVSGSNRLLVSGDGSLYAQRGADYLVFAPDGARQGVHRFPSGQPVFRPGSREQWVSSRGKVLYRDTSGEVQLELSRHPSGNWLQVEDLAVVADGSVVLYDSPRERTESLVLLDRAGTERKTIELPDAVHGYFVSLTERWIAISKYDDEAFLIEIADGTVSHITSGAQDPESGYWKLGFSPDGRELWWASQNPLELLRFALPAD